MPNTTTRTAAAEKSRLYNQLKCHGCYDIPRGLKLETLQDIYTTILWDEWKTAVSTEDKTRKRLSHELTRLQKEAEPFIGLEDATQRLFDLFEELSPKGTFNACLDSVPAEKLPLLLKAFSGSLAA